MTQQRTTTKPKSSKLAGFFSDTFGELKKVVWLTRREVTYLTVLVLLVSIAASVLLGLVDFGFAGLIDKIVIGRGEFS